MKHNYKMKLSYDGTRYYGWEHQPGQEMTIQGKLETVLSRMLAQERDNSAQAQNGARNEDTVPQIQNIREQQNICKQDEDSLRERVENPQKKDIAQQVTVIGAGRTDAGVHAREMTANVILDTEMTEEEILSYMNRYLPDDISINELKICADRFHSRFKAKGKTYCYTCWYAPDGSKPVFDRKYVTVLEKMPDIQRMREAASYLVGMHDFRSFCGNSHMKKSTVRLVDSIEIKVRGPYIRLFIHGSGFLQNMVRIITGTLLEVGYGKRQSREMPDLLAACDRKLAGPTAPAKGLCLMSVDY